MPLLTCQLRTYSIGKERIVKGKFAYVVATACANGDPFLAVGVARALNSKIYCDGRKRSILLCQADPELHTMLTTDPLEVRSRS